MPYKINGSTVLHQKGGKWSKKATAKSPASAKRMVNLLRGVEHGWQPTGAKSKRKMAMNEIRKRAESE